ncbi:pterocarpan synthase 1-like [Cicer arietinum]|uniref:Dirigent protein n=1 Tax=Cicer arietinum TaxID=3827 RepID=A0A1S2XRZ4_CICAR|nr:dirigent protein 22-like [Cicer arietinum]
MAHSKTLLYTFFTTFLFSSLVTANYYQNISPSYLGFKQEKLTHIHFFFHDIVSGPKPTVSISVESPLSGKSKSPLPFGSLVIIEDPLTVGPELNSKQIGKAQGFYVTVSQDAVLELELVMGMTFTFTDGKFNGSAITVLGRNAIGDLIREMPIIGGTGEFRFARGFLQAKTHFVDYHKGDAHVEYNVYVFHYESSTSSEEVFANGVQFIAEPTLGKI